MTVTGIPEAEAHTIKQIPVCELSDLPPGLADPGMVYDDRIYGYWDIYELPPDGNLVKVLSPVLGPIQIELRGEK